MKKLFSNRNIQQQQQQQQQQAMNEDMSSERKASNRIDSNGGVLYSGSVQDDDKKQQMKSKMRRKRKERKSSGGNSASKRQFYGLTDYPQHLQVPNKISVLGSKGTGKTSLILSLIRQRWHPDYESYDDMPKDDQEEGEDVVDTDDSDIDGRPVATREKTTTIAKGQDGADEDNVQRQSPGHSPKFSDVADSVVSEDDDEEENEDTMASSSNSFVLAETVETTKLAQHAATAKRDPVTAQFPEKSTPILSSENDPLAEDEETSSISLGSQPRSPKTDPSSTLSKLIRKGQKLRTASAEDQYLDTATITATASTSRDSNEMAEISSETTAGEKTVESKPNDSTTFQDPRKLNPQQLLHEEVEALLVESKQLENRIRLLETQDRTEEQNARFQKMRSRLDVVRQRVRIKLPAYRVAKIQLDAAKRNQNNRLSRRDFDPAPAYETNEIHSRKLSVETEDDGSLTTYTESMTEASSEFTDSTYDTNQRHVKEQDEQDHDQHNSRMSIVGMQSLDFLNNSPNIMSPRSGNQQPGSHHDNSHPKMEEGTVHQKKIPASSEQTLPTFEDYIKRLPPAYTLMEGIRKFNQANAKKAVQYMIGHGVLEDHPAVIARFLATTASLKKSQVGEYLGRAEHEPVLKSYCDYHNSTVLRTKSFIESIRIFLSLFNLPSEGQMVTRIAEQFALSYVRTHPDMSVRNGDSVTLLACALLMLNTDLHHPLVKNKMTREQFHAILSDHKDIPADFINEMYTEIRDHPMLVENDREDDITEEGYLYPDSYPNEMDRYHGDKKRKGLLGSLKLKKKNRNGSSTPRMMMGAPRTPTSSISTSTSSSISSSALPHNSNEDTLVQPHIFYRTKAFFDDGIHDLSIKDTDNWINLRQHAENLGAMDDEIMKSDLFICTYSVTDLESFVMVQGLIDRIMKLKVWKNESPSRHVSPQRRGSSPSAHGTKDNHVSNTLGSDQKHQRKILARKGSVSTASMNRASHASGSTHIARRRTLSFFGGPRRHDDKGNDNESLSGFGLMSSSSAGETGMDGHPFVEKGEATGLDSMFEEDLSAKQCVNNIFLAALNIDVPEDQRMVSFQDGANFALKKGIPFFEVSTVLNKNVRELFTMSFESMMDMQSRAEKKLLDESKKAESASRKNKDRKERRNSKKNRKKNSNKKKKVIALDELLSLPKTYI